MHLKYRLASFLFIFGFSFQAGAQQNFRSPYSLFGIGVPHYSGFADNIAVGRNGGAYRFEGNFSFDNPASLSALKQSAFNVATYMDLGNVSNSAESQKFTNSGFNNIALGVPVEKLRGGLAIGLLPFSDVGYNIVNIKDSSGISLRNEFEGNGGLSRFNLGFASEIHPNISVGFNYSYLFGQVSETQRRRYPGSRFMTSYAEENSIFLKGSQFDLGMQIHLNKDSGTRHILGLVFTTGTKLKGEVDRFAYTYTEYFTSTEVLWDTILNIRGNNATVKIPSSISLSYAVGNQEKWQLMAGFKNTNWSQYRNIFNDNSNFSNDQKYSLGFFICPQPIYDRTVKDNKIQNYLKSIRYSVGVNHNTGYININDTKISETGFSAGLGFPFVKMHKKPDGTRVRITSRIFVTGEYVTRGTQKDNLIREDFFRITLGLNFSDSWFNKRLFN